MRCLRYLAPILIGVAILVVKILYREDAHGVGDFPEKSIDQGDDNDKNLSTFHHYLSDIHEGLERKDSAIEGGNFIQFDQIERRIFESNDLSRALDEMNRDYPNSQSVKDLLTWSVNNYCEGKKFDSLKSNIEFWNNVIADHRISYKKRDYYASQIRKCEPLIERFARSGIHITDEVLIRAASNGLASAQAVLVANCSNIKVKKTICESSFNDLLRERDPQIVDIIRLGLLSSSSEEFQGRLSDVSFSFGLALAKCKLGADCSKTSEALREICGNSCPPYENVDGALQIILSKNEYLRAVEVSERMYSLIVAGKSHKDELSVVDSLIHK